MSRKLSSLASQTEDDEVVGTPEAGNRVFVVHVSIEHAAQLLRREMAERSAIDVPRGRWSAEIVFDGRFIRLSCDTGEKP